MELRQLKYFIRAAELSNFTEAANTLFISQSTLSQQIKQLEEELDIQLFDRIAKRVKLTEAGSLFLPYARKTLRKSEDGKALLADLRNLKTGTLTIGVTYGLTDLLIRAIADFSLAYPDVKMMVEFGTSDELLEKLNQVKLDFVLSFIPVQENQLFKSEPLFKASLSMIVHQAHRLASQKSISLQEIGRLPLLLPVKSYSIRNFLDKNFEREHIVPDIRMEVNDINTLLQLANSGKWITILMNSSLFHYPALRAVPIAGQNMVRQATITWAVQVYKKRAAAVFADLLIKYAPVSRSSE